MEQYSSSSEVLMPKSCQATSSEEGFVRGRWLSREVDARLGEFSEQVPIRVCCATWNVNGKKIDVDLSSWLCRAEPADLYAIGVQEMVDLTAVNVVADGKTAKKRAEEWRRVLAVALSKIGEYELVCQRHMVGVFLCVFARAGTRSSREISFGSWACTEACSSVAGCGVMGMLGNKGGVSIRLRVLDTTLCFVCAHLAAHRDNVQGRNSDFACFISKTEFKATEATTTIGGVFLPSSSLSTDEDNSSSETVKIEDHDVVFWLGDLNYRVHSAIDVSEVFSRAEANDLEFLKANDQLNVERAAGRVLRGFHEAEVSFPVTYKYQPGAPILERRPEKKLRAPAWCDRILWRTRSRNCAVSIQSYESTRDLSPSDHNPVRADFVATLLKIDRDKRSLIHSNLVKRLVAAGGKTDLALVFDPPEERVFDLGEIRYRVSTSKRLVVSNPSAFVRHWRFSGTSRTWLSVEPAFGTLFPGESTEIIVAALVDSRHARHLTARAESLADVLCIRCDNARDTFFKVRGEWIPSRWGMSLEDLCASSTSPRQPLPVPKELWHIIDAIDMDAPHLFFTPGDPEQIRKIRQALDQNQPLPTAELSPYSLADSLVSFLAALAAPVVPRHLLPETEIDDVRAYTRDELLRGLTPASYNTFIYCLAFFRQLLKHAHTNFLTPPKLAAVIINCMLPQDDDHHRAIRGSLLAGSGAAYENRPNDDDAYFFDVPSSSSSSSVLGAALVAPPSPQPDFIVNQRHYVTVAFQYLLQTPAL